MHVVATNGNADAKLPGFLLSHHFIFNVNKVLRVRKPVYCLQQALVGD